MPADSSLALQKAIYTALTGDPTLDDLVEGVFDFVPPDTAYPYVTLGEDTALDWSNITTSGKSLTLSIHTWSRGAGRSECKTIQAAVRGALDNARLTLEGGAHLITLQFDFEETMLDPDGVTYHGVQRFRALTQET